MLLFWRSSNSRRRLEEVSLLTKLILEMLGVVCVCREDDSLFNVKGHLHWVITCCPKIKIARHYHSCISPGYLAGVPLSSWNISEPGWNSAGLEQYMQVPLGDCTKTNCPWLQLQISLLPGGWGLLSPNQNLSSIIAIKGKDLKRLRYVDVLHFLSLFSHQVFQAWFRPGAPARLQHGPERGLPEPDYWSAVRRNPLRQLSGLHLQPLWQTVGCKQVLKLTCYGDI